MKFGEKLQRLRKEKGMSQEELSFQLKVSRQAVSKWENDQGYPETEKMLMIGTIFSVSMDYLLKDQGEQRSEDEKGYYASREVVQAYLAKEERDAKKISFAVLLLICSGIPVLMFPEQEDSWSIVSMIIIAMAISIFVWMGFEENPYKQLEKEPLLFDPTYLQEVKLSYQSRMKKLKAIFIGAILLFFTTFGIAIVIDDVLHLPEGPHEAIYLILIGLGVCLMIYASCVMESYEPIVDNEKYQSEKNGYSWLYYITCGTAALIYVGFGLYYGDVAWKIGWVIIAIAAVLTYGVIQLLSRKNR